MSRVIKFRAWDAPKGMFDIDVLALTEGPWSSEGRKGVSIPHQPSIYVMQFTGLQDINGVDIYESDIVDGYIGGLVVNGSAVIFDDGAFSLDLGNYLPCLYEAANISIIGNIHEDPELLEVTP